MKNQTNITYNNSVANRKVLTKPAPHASRSQLLKNSDEPEVLRFLRKRPVHTIVMTSFIKDNGIESPLNRGRFYGYRNLTNGKLEGVALIGHTTLVEANSEWAIAEFACSATLSLRMRIAHI